MEVTEFSAAESARRASELRLQLAVEALGFASWDFDLVTSRLTWSDSHFELFGCDRERDGPARMELWRRHVHPDDLPGKVAAVSAAMTSGVPYEHTYRIRRGDTGELRTMRARGRTLPGEDGRPARFVGVVFDITEQASAEEAVATQLAAMAAVAKENWELVQQIRESDRRKDEFLATLAHELRNPLAPIGNSLELLRRAAGDGEAVARARDTMERQMGHLVHLVDDLLDASRITSGKFTLRREPVALPTVLLQAVEMTRPALERAGQTLDLRLPIEPAWLFADATRLTQVFTNLLGNAAKFGGRGVVSLTASVAGGQAVVLLTDRGVGIPPDRIGEIFEMFAQVDRAPERVAGGLGIGLALVKRLVEMHDGRVDACSDGEGRGSTFRVTLPLVPAPSGAVPPTPAPMQRPPSRRIVVADDNRDSADSMAALLRMSGHEASVAYDGAEAVALSAQIRPDAVLLDLGMPRLDGHEAAGQIRGCLGREVLLVAVTGWGDEQSRQRTRAAGFDAHLTKPVDLPRLLALLAPQ